MSFLYIDPGTGSMLFSVLIGVVSTLVFFARKLFMKLKFSVSGGRTERISQEKIPYVIFSDHKRYWNVFKPVCDEFERRGIAIQYWTASPDDEALNEHYEYVKCLFIGEGNKAFARLNMMNAGVVLSTTPGLDVYQWKRSRTVDCYVHIMHSVDEALGYRMFGLDFYDSVLLTGDFQGTYIRQLEKMRCIPAKELVTVGCTYMDSMASAAEKLAHSSQSGMKKILLAPSWGASAILSRFGGRIIEALLATGYTVVVRPHPQTLVSEKPLLDSLMAQYPESGQLHWNFDNDNFTVMSESDIMITDFSGIIFDYTLIFDRPVIYADTSYDASPYDAAWFDGKLWRFDVLTKLGVPLQEESFGSLKEIIDNTLASDAFQAGRDSVRDECWQNRGNAAVATVDYLIGKKVAEQKVS